MDDIYIKKSDVNNWIGKYFHKDLISVNELVGCIEDLDEEIDRLKEIIDSLQQDIEDNYRPLKKEEQYGISYRDYL